MMKKTAFVMLGMFVLSTLGFAGQGQGNFGHEGKNMTPEQKAKWEAVKKDKAEYFKKAQALVDKYNKASDADKPAVKQELTNLVSAQTDKDLAVKKEMSAKMQEKISETEADKTAVVNKKVDFLLSPEGQAKMKQMKGMKNDKKDFKKGKSEKKSK
ncbi:MAG: hypothetical protein FWC57_05120 [Endomicrobia bacterium]|nr:hypothetical protein [Endomicrobiia bacterium]